VFSPGLRYPAAMRVHLFVIGWEGKHDAVERIVSSASTADFRTVIYSNASGERESGTGEWIAVPNTAFFGLKFARALECFHADADVFLLVQGDAVYEDWSAIVAQCRAAFTDDTVGVWAPHVDYSWWTNERVVMGQGSMGSVVAQTDGICFAFRRSTVKRLRRLDYAGNNLGWGVEWAAIAHAATEGRYAWRDQTLTVQHPQGSGYNHTEARQQQAWFLERLTPQEIGIVHRLLSFVMRPQKRKSPG